MVALFKRNIPRPNQFPSLPPHNPSNQAVVTLNGKDHSLGPWPLIPFLPRQFTTRHRELARTLGRSLPW